MSAVRMCDKCGEVFSELDLGWQTFSATTVDEDDNGRQVTKTTMLDACSSCAIKAPSREERRLRQLERGAGIGGDVFNLPSDATVEK